MASYPIPLTHWSLRDLSKILHKWFQAILAIDGGGISCETDLRSMSMDPTDDKSTLAQVMAWCRQKTSHYLSRCWPRSMSPYGVTRPQGFNQCLPRSMAGCQTSPSTKQWASTHCELLIIGQNCSRAWNSTLDKQKLYAISLLIVSTLLILPTT